MAAGVLSLCSPVCPTLYHNLIRNHFYWGKPEQAPHLQGKRVKTVGWSMRK